MSQHYPGGTIGRAALLLCALVIAPLSAIAAQSIGVTPTPTYSQTPGPLISDPGTAYYNQSAPGAIGCGAASASVNTYVSYGYTGCTVGPVTFYNFSTYGYGNNTTTYDGSQIDITPGIDASGRPTLAFSSALFSQLAGTGSNTYVIEYNIDPPIDILGFRLADAPFAGNTSVVANICENSYLATYCSTYPPATCETDEYGYCIPDPTITLNEFNQTVDTSFIPGTQFLDVLLTITIDASNPDNGPAIIPGFSAGVNVVSEPVELTLTGIGIFALLGATIGTRRRRRSIATA